MAKGKGGLKRIPIKIVETGEVFESIRACARAIGGYDRGIHDFLNGKRSNYRGYTFEFVDEIDEIEPYFDE